MRPLLAVVLLAGCGSSLDSNFAGIYNGLEELTLTGVGSYVPIRTTFVIAVSGNTATTTNCAGVATWTGSGDTASSSATVVCPAESAGGTFSCASVVLTFTSTTANLVDKTMTVVATGTAVGCGASYPASSSFSGDKP